MSRTSRPTFFAGVRAGAAPLLLWALHFAFCYVGLAVGCTAILHGASALDPQQLRTALAVGTAVALGAALWLVVRAWQHHRRDGAGLLPGVRLISAAVALVAIAWTGLPLAWLRLCQAA